MKNALDEERERDFCRSLTTVEQEKAEAMMAETPYLFRALINKGMVVCNVTFEGGEMAPKNMNAESTVLNCVFKVPQEVHLETNDLSEYLTNRRTININTGLKPAQIDPCLVALQDSLIDEKGMPTDKGDCVCIWRSGPRVGDNQDSGRYNTTAGEFLSNPENQSGIWLIDGGWGGPPGPIYVRWNETSKTWENGGYRWRMKNDPWFPQS